MGEGTLGPLATEGGLYFHICATRVSSYATADKGGLPTYRGPV